MDFVAASARAVAAAESARLCVLCAGNCNDLDLPFLLDHFAEVHLVDIDAQALAGGVERASAQDRTRLVTHGGIDLAGSIDRVDAWGDRFPSEDELADFVAESPRRIAAAVGETYDVVLSSCLLSQLCLPFQNALALGLLEWRRLFNAMASMHLATLAALTRSGGRCALACDVLSQGGAEVQRLAATTPRDRLLVTLVQRIADGLLAPDPNPYRLLAMLQGPELRALAADPHRTDPWLWDVGADVQLVYGLSFTRT